MCTILITGFGRFPGSPVNPSGMVAVRVTRRRRPAFAGTRRIAHVFATRYDAVDRELPALLARERPEIVVLFGVAPRSHHVRIEERARNRRSVLFPDAGGYRPAALAIAPGIAARRNAVAPAYLIQAARAVGVRAVRSRNAGTYLCNYAYWRALEAASIPGGPGLVIFVHVPPIGFKARAKRPRTGTSGPCRKARRPARLGALVRAGEAIVLRMLSLARARDIATKFRGPSGADESPVPWTMFR
jgi:pyroglutamyl-peptidase